MRPSARIPRTLLLLWLAAAAGACVVSPPEDAALTKAEARAQSGKSDSGLDLCDELGWYGDGECDDFCPAPDPDCSGPVDSDAGPSDSDAGPADSDAGPSDSDAGPSDSDAGPSDSDAGPSDSDAGPSDSDAGPEEAACGGFAGLTCPADAYCAYLGSSCGWADQLGVCRTRPTFCAEIYSPVCGCDGRSYGNACEAHAAGIDVRLSGACR